MKLLLTLLAVAMLTISVGCEKTEPAKPAVTPPPVVKPAVDAEKPAGTSSTTPTDENIQLVSLKLPGMSWGGCESSVRAAFAKVEGITDVETDTSERVASFKAPKDMDVDAKLNEIVASGNTHVKGWSRN